MKRLRLLIIFMACLFLPVYVQAQYIGDTFSIDLSKGGLNHSQNTDNVPATAMVDGSRNINIHKGGRSKRGGTDNVNSSVIGGTPRIWGVYQFRLQNGNAFILTADANGEILKDYDDSSPIKTGLTIDRPVHFVTFNNLCIICTGNDLPQVWNGTGNTADIVDEAADWTGGNYPRKMILHGRGASERLWAIYGKTDANSVYYSSINAGDGGSTEPTFSTAASPGAGNFYIETADGFGILNGVEFGDRLILAGKNQTYIIDDTDTDTANWGYNKAQWKGGTASDRLFINAQNDIISMDEFGNIFSVVSVQSYGDYQRASLTRPAFIDEFIRENIKLSAIADFHMVYDPVLRCIYFFVVRKGQSDVDTALVYFIDRGPLEGWIIKDNRSADSGFKASSSALVRKAVGDYKIYTGGMDDGFVWELETTAKNDNGAAYASGFKTMYTAFGDPRIMKQYNTGWILAQATGNFTFLVDIFIDGVYIKQESAIFTVSGATYGTAVYGTATYGGVEPKEASFDIGVEGKRIQYNVFNNNANEDIFATMLLTDFINLGRLP